MAETYKRRVGERIRQAREAKGWSQPQLSRQLPERVTAAYISRWETGKSMPGTTYLELLADALGVEVAFFLMEAPEEGTPDLMQTLSSNGNGPEDDLAVRIVSLLEQQNALLADVAGGLGDLMAVVERARAEADARATAKPSGARKAAGS